jgi:hypothetical protein
MKALARFRPFGAVVVVLFASLGSHTSAQQEESPPCILESESPTAVQLGGRYIPARDTFNVLVVFAEFPDDVFDTTNVNWPKYPLAGVYPGPTYRNTFIDSLVSQNSQNGNVSHYFRDMSMGVFKLTGKAYHVVTPQTRQWYYSNGNAGHGRVNRDVLLKLDSTISFGPFDKWIRGTNYNHMSGQDSIVDMIFMLYRSATEDGLISNFNFAGGQADLGFVGEFRVDENGRRIQTGTVQSGLTAVVGHNANGRTLDRPPYRVSIHELSHFFFPASNSWHNGGGFWAMLNNWMFRFNSAWVGCANSFERELVGWHYPDSIGTSGGSWYNLALSDYITTNKSYKVKVPSGNADEFFRIENHQRISQFDTPEMLDPSAKGLYVIHQFGSFWPDEQMRLLPADGRWNWTVQEAVYPPRYPNGLPVFKKTGVNRVNGYDDSWLIPYSFPLPFTPNPMQIEFYRDRESNQLLERPLYRGDGNDAFTLSKNRVFSPWSNPNSQTQLKQKSWIAIEVVNELENGTIVFNLHIDSANCLLASPSKPQDLSVSAYIDDWGNYLYPRLTWSAMLEPDVINNGHIDVYRRLKEGGVWSSWGILASNLPGTATEYIDVSIPTAGTGNDSAQYKILAWDNTGKSSVFSDPAKINWSPDMWKRASKTDIQLGFALLQNYPNPFNPTTTFRYTLPEDTHVSLRIFDFLGREVTTLVNQYKKAGRYEIQFDASSLASGVYLYKIRAGAFTDMKRMLVLK